MGIARKLLERLVGESGSLKTEDEEDVRSEGKLRLLLELVQGLDCRAVGNSNHGGLVQRIILGRVF